MECQLDGAGTKEWKECWAMPLEWVDMAVSVSKVEWIGDLDMDMPRWVEEMKEVLVETVKWTTYATARQISDSWMDFQDKVPAVAS
jgi:hypothetical protein